MYNFRIPCSPSHVIVPKYCHVGASLGDTKPFWKYVRSQKQEHFGITALRSNGSLYTDSSSKSEILNKQFKPHSPIFS